MKCNGSEAKDVRQPLVSTSFAKLIFEGSLFVSFLYFRIFQTSVPWLVAGVAVAGTFPPRFETKRIGWNKTLLSIWLT